MQNTVSSALRALGLVAAISLSGCSGDDEGEVTKPSRFELSFAAVADGKRIGCGDRVEGLGPDGTDSISIADLRFFVSNLKFWDGAQKEIELILDDNEFQYSSAAGRVALVDLTATTEGSCAGGAIAFAEGTKRTNQVLTGQTLVDQVEGVSFDVGVPQGVMQDVIATHSPEGAPSPLAELQWTWATGYRHFVLNFAVSDADGDRGDGYAHVGSRDCGPADGSALEDRDRCGFVNTPRVMLEKFDLASNVVTLDVPELLQGLDFVSSIYDQDTFEVIGEGPGVECHSSPMQPDCPTLFDHLGLDMATGEANAAKNAVFGVE